MQQTLRPLLGITVIAGLVAASHTAVRRHTVTVPTMTSTVAHTVMPSAPSQSYGNLPLSFESNQGQTDSRVQFLSHGPGYSLFLTSNEAVLSLHTSGFGVRGSGFGKSRQMFAGTADCKCGSSPAGVFNEPRTPIPEPRVGTPNPDAVLRLKLVGANPAPKTVGLEQQPGVVNYFRGKDPAKWHTHIPTYSRVEYKSVYPGIDMVYYGNQKQLEYDWVVAPGADVHQIQLAVKGAEKATLTSQGDLQLHTSCGDVVQHAPVVYQEVEGVRKSVAARLVLEDRIGAERRVGFAVGAYDHTRPLVIDPVLVYSTYLGGSGAGQSSGDNCEAITVDGSGNAYLTGEARSTDFPVEAPYQSTLNGSTDVFVSEMNASGTALIYSTYLGGSNYEGGTSIAVDSTGNAYITGVTGSSDFPVKNALFATQPNIKGSGFVTKLAAGGAYLIYSTYLGGSGMYADAPAGIAVDGTGNAYITGGTYATNFPLKNAYQNSKLTPATQTTCFVTKLNSTGSALIYSTYLGRSSQDSCAGIAADSSGNAYITGQTSSANFPVKNAMQGTLKGSRNAFVTVFNPTGSALVYSTYLGGSGGDDEGFAIAVDGADNAYITGRTDSTDFPTKAPYQASNHWVYNAFVTKFSATGTLNYSTYLGGSGDGIGNADTGTGIAVNSAGEACVTGITNSPDFPTHFPIQPTYGGGGDAFVTVLNAAGSGLIYSTYLGGSQTDLALGIAVDSSNNVYVTGYTLSSDLPIQNPLQALNHAAATSGFNGFVARIGSFNWQAVDVAVGSDNKARLLWNIQNESFTNWSVDATGTITYGAITTPASGTSVQSISAGADGITRILGNNTDGTAKLWLGNSINTLTNSFSFGPYSGWSAVDVTVGSDNKSRLLWNKSDGTAGVWTVSNTGGTSNLANYGPNAGWTATRIAAGADGLTRLLWTKTDGSAAIWLLNANNTYKTGFTYGPNTGWSAIDLSVGSDNKARLLWVKSDNTAGVWTIDNSGVTSNLTNYGPYTGWTATKLASGADGLSRLLWFKGDGTQAVWLLNANNSYNSAVSFGPY